MALSTEPGTWLCGLWFPEWLKRGEDRGSCPQPLTRPRPFSPGISYVAPHLNNLYFLPLCRRWGVYAVVRGLFLLKLGLSLLMLLAGPDRPGLLCLFIARYAPPSRAPTPLSPLHACLLSLSLSLCGQQPCLHRGHL